MLLLGLGSPAEVPMDNVDSLAGQLSPATELWSDMIIFSSVTPSKCVWGLMPHSTRNRSFLGRFLQAR